MKKLYKFQTAGKFPTYTFNRDSYFTIPSSTITSTTPVVVEPIQHARTTEATNRGMTVEELQNLEEMQRKASHSGVVIEKTKDENKNNYNSQWSGDSETNKAELERQKEGEEKAKEEASKAANAILSLSLPSTYVNTALDFAGRKPLGTGTSLAIDFAPALIGGGFGLARLGKTALKTPVPKSLLSGYEKLLAALQKPAYVSPKTTDLDLLLLQKGLTSNPNFVRVNKPIIMELPFKIETESVLSGAKGSDKLTTGLIVGKLKPPAFTLYYTGEEIPNRLRRFGFNPDRLETRTTLNKSKEPIIDIKTQGEWILDAGTHPNYIFYSPDLDAETGGFYWSGKKIPMVRLSESTAMGPLFMRSTAFHEGGMHATEHLVNKASNGEVQKMYEAVSKQIKGNVAESSDWKELRATLGEVNRKLVQKITLTYKVDFKTATEKELPQLINKMSDVELVDVLGRTNGYGLDYAAAIVKDRSLILKIKHLMKYAPVAATPVVGSQIQAERNGGKLNYLNYIK